MSIQESIILEIFNPFYKFLGEYVIVSKLHPSRQIGLTELMRDEGRHLLNLQLREISDTDPLRPAVLLTSILSGVIAHLKFSFSPEEYEFLRPRLLRKCNELFSKFATPRVDSGTYQYCTAHPIALLGRGVSRDIQYSPDRDTKIETIDLNRYINSSNLQTINILDVVNISQGVCPVCRNLQLIGGTKDAQLRRCTKE